MPKNSLESGVWNLEDLIEEYGLSLKLVRNAKKRTSNKQQRELLSSMEESTNAALTKMKRYINEYPTNVDRRTILVDPHKIGFFHKYDPIEQLFEDSSNEVRPSPKLDLSFLSKRELDSLVLYELDGWSYEEIAEYLHIHPGSVARYIRRARDKFLEIHGVGVQTTLLDSKGGLGEGSYLSGMFRDSEIDTHNAQA